MCLGITQQEHNSGRCSTPKLKNLKSPDHGPHHRRERTRRRPRDVQLLNLHNKICQKTSDFTVQTLFFSHPTKPFGHPQGSDFTVQTRNFGCQIFAPLIGNQGRKRRNQTPDEKSDLELTDIYQNYL